MNSPDPDEFMEMVKGEGIILGTLDNLLLGCSEPLDPAKDSPYDYTMLAIRIIVGQDKALTMNFSREALEALMGYVFQHKEELLPHLSS